MSDYALPDWLLDVVACPLCLGHIERRPSSAAHGATTCSCIGCSALFPVLAGVPVLLSAPHTWMAQYRDAILASLAEVGAIGPDTLAVVDAFAEAAGRVEPHRFGDDWIPGEGHSALTVETPERFTDSLGAFVAEATTRNPVTVIGSILTERPLGTTVEVGVGSGVLATHLARHAEHLLVTDLSLRAVLRAQAAIGDEHGPVAAAVMDAENLALAPGAVDTLVAMNVVDLLDDPFAFAEEAAERLSDNGRFAVCTPDPTLGDPEGDAEAVDRLIEMAGLRVVNSEDAVPWLRPHSARELQIYFTRIVVAEPGDGHGHGHAHEDDDDDDDDSTGNEDDEALN